MATTKKDYQTIAESINKNKKRPAPVPMDTDTYETGYQDGYRSAVRAVADVLGDTGPRFDRWQFMRDCGYED